MLESDALAAWVLNRTRVFVLFLFAEAGAVHAADIAVDGPSALAEAIQAAKDGDTLKLSDAAPYNLEISKRNFATAITITSAQADHPANILKAEISESSGVKIDGVTFDSSTAQIDRKTAILQILKSHDVQVSNCIAKGRGTAYLSKDSGPDAGGGNFSMTRWSNNVKLSGLKLSHFYHGVAFLESTDIEVSHNLFTQMQGDPVRLGGVQRVNVADNRVEPGLGADTAVNHPDGLQLWSAHAEIASSDITIERNIFLSGDGPSLQDIFMGNEQVDGNPAALDRYYSNIKVRDNLIYDGHLHGITVGQTNGLEISNNTLIPNPRATMGTGDNRHFWPPTIRVAKGSTNVKIEKNVVFAISAPPEVNLSSNYLLNWGDNVDERKLVENFMGNYFAGPLPDSAFKARPGGAVSKGNLGSILTH